MQAKSQSKWWLTPWRWVRDSVMDFLDDAALAQAAGIAFYAMLSMAPLLVVVIALAGAIWGSEAVRGEVVAQFRGLMGEEAANAIEQIIQRASEQPSRGTLATLLGIGALLLGALGVFGQIKRALNIIWEVEAGPGGGVWRFVRDRLLSFAMVMCIAFLLLVSLAVSAALAAAGGWIERMIAVPEGAMRAINLGVSVVFIAAMFAAMYKVLPDVRIAWRDVWIGALTTSALFNLGKFLIGLYLGRSATVSVYGAAGSLVLITLWMYYSAAIFLVGAEFTQVQARWRGAAIEPARGAQRTDGERAVDQQPSTSPAAGAYRRSQSKRSRRRRRGRNTKSRRRSKGRGGIRTHE